MIQTLFPGYQRHRYVKFLIIKLLHIFGFKKLFSTEIQVESVYCWEFNTK